MGILRLAHIDVRTPDLDLATAYYTGVMGLQQVSREADRVYFKCWDEEDHHSLRMRSGSIPTSFRFAEHHVFLAER